MTGRVIWWSVKKGYGFIAREGARDLFVHWSGIESLAPQRNLERDQAVEFEIAEGPRGEYATRVRVLEG